MLRAPKVPDRARVTVAAGRHEAIAGIDSPGLKHPSPRLPAAGTVLHRALNLYAPVTGFMLCGEFGGVPIQDRRFAHFANNDQGGEFDENVPVKRLFGS